MTILQQVSDRISVRCSPRAPVAVCTFVILSLLISASHAGSVMDHQAAVASSSSSGSGSGASGGGGTSTTTAPTAQSLAQATAAASARADTAMNMTLQALQTLRSAQNTARSSAQAGANNLGVNPNNTALQLPNVPDGLATGGLVPDSGLSSSGVANPVVSWVGAKTPTQTTSGGQTLVDIVQTQQQALLYWQSFNVGKNTVLTFDQSAGGSNVGQWVAFNKINDPSLAPSQILGSIQALGQVYVINPNGIIFGGSSQVNTHALVASSLPINDNLIAQGLLNSSDTQFLFSTQPLAAGKLDSNGFTPVFTDPIFKVNSSAATYTLAQSVVSGGKPTVSYFPSGPNPVALVSGTDYTTSVNGSGQTVLTFTTAGLSKVGSSSLTASYVPATVHTGDVTVQAGAQLTATPLLSQPVTLANATATQKLSDIVAAGTAPVVNYTPSGGVATALLPGVDYTLTVGTDGKTVVTLTQNGVGKVAGAPLSVTYTPVSNGGRVALIGANVNNAGTISTPEGQTILAAGLQVGLTAHDTNDPSLRGLDVYVGAADQFSGVAVNSGVIDAPRADVTLAGKTVTQSGAIDSSTSVALNGRVDLQADYGALLNTSYDPVNNPTVAPFLFQSTGTVNLGAGSVTRILPELSSNATVVGTQLALRSAINMTGQSIDLAAGSAILAPNALVTLNAGNWLNGGLTFGYTGGQVSMESGALLDVAGSENVSASVAENIISLQLTGTELENFPLQRNGVLRGKTIQVDITQYGVDSNGNTWVGTPLADVTGYVNLIQRSVGELTTAGGTVAINSGGAVNLQTGSSIDVSGGWINYQGGNIQTTKLLSGGSIIDISKADPNVVYSGIYNGFNQSSAKWGLSGTYLNPIAVGATYRDGYTQGGSGGALSIQAPTMTLQGGLYANTAVGQLQRVPDTTVQSTFSSTTVTPTLQSIFSVPAAGSLSLSFQKQDSITQNTYSPTPPDIVFTSSGPLNPADAKELDLSPDLVNRNGFGRVSIGNGDGNIVVAPGTVLDFPALGSLTLTAANLDIEGKIYAPGGSLKFTVYDYSPQPQFPLTDPNAVPQADATRGNFTLGAAATLSTAGLIVDDRATSSTALTLPLATAGGTVTINSFSANLVSGSSIDVSGGLAVSGAGKQSFGNAGSLMLSAGQDPGYGSLVGGSFLLNAALSGYAGSGKSGGSLNLQEPVVQIGSGVGSLSPDFFSQGGFATFNMTGLDSVTIQANTSIVPLVQNYVANQGVNGISLQPMLLPEGLRSAVNLSFVATGVQDPGQPLGLAVRGDFYMGGNALIQTDPQSVATHGVSISGYTSAILGSIIAPGGTISVSGKSSSSFSSDSSTALVTTYIGPNSLLSTAGTTLLVPDTSGHGYRTGSVLNGGSITIKGNIVAAAGSVLDVSGASDTLYLPASYSGVGSLSTLVPTLSESNGGTITLAGTQELFTDATLKGASGGATARGGSLVVSSGFLITGNSTAVLNPNLIIAQSSLTIPVPFAAGSSAVGLVVKDAGNNALPFLGHLAVDSFAAGGFDSLTLSGIVQFQGPVSITEKRSITVASNGFILGDSAISLNAPYVSLGETQQAPYSSTSPLSNIFTDSQNVPFYTPPTYGSGSLTVNAGLIDIGYLSLQNIGQANFYADKGDIRGDGVLDVAGDITLRAGQIYPLTATTFTVAAYDHGGIPGSVTITASGTRQLPLSAGGTLDIYGSIINQNGVLRAPLGSINLGWDGVGATPVDLITGSGLANSSGTSVATISIKPTQQLLLGNGSMTSVSGVDPSTGQALTLPYGTNLNNSLWIDPTGTDITTLGPPVKSVNISALNVNDQAGSLIDISGGGNLYAYRWVSGLGGSKDILSSSSAFAVVPGYQAAFAPIDLSVDSTGAHPYLNSSLKVGDSIHLDAGSGLPAGDYTLLPARYALLPGAYLITPKTSTPTDPAQMADGSSIVSGYRYNDLSALPSGQQPLFSSFEVVSQSVLNARAEYDPYLANTFFVQSAKSNNVSVPRLPLDSGQLVLSSTQTMVIKGLVDSQAPTGGLGGLVDINSPSDILIAGPGATAAPGVLVLDAAGLSNFGAESLLIGGVRQSGGNGTSISVSTNNITVDNAGTPLTGSDIILVANQNLTIAGNATIKQTGTSSGLDNTLLLGNSTAGSGDGVLLRVSSAAATQLQRSGVDASTVPYLRVGAGAQISGTSVTLDSTYGTNQDAAAVLSGQTLNLGSGQISLQLDSSVAVPPTNGLVLTSATLTNLGNTATALSLLSYSSIDIYGAGQVGSPTYSSLVLHAAALQGFNTGGGTVKFLAQSIQLDNSPGRTVTSSVTASPGTLEFDAGTLQLGAGQVQVNGFQNLTLNATGGMLVGGTGNLTAQGNIHVATPEITGSALASQAIVAGGSLLMDGSGNATVDSLGGLGAALVLQGADVTVDSAVVFKSGGITLHALTGNVTVGGRLDAGGTAKTFFDQTQYSSGGQINLQADNGSVNLQSGSMLSVAAQPVAGNAGSISVSAPTGTFLHNGVLSGQAAAGYKTGTFNLDVATLDVSASLGGNDLSPLESALAAGSFSNAQNLRIRGGGNNTVNNDVFLVSNSTVTATATAHSFTLSADQGSITVNGTLDASGNTGGSISLMAHGSVVLESGANLTVKGVTFSDAGKGGSVDLEAGSAGNGTFSNLALGSGPQIDIQANSTLDLSVAGNNASSAGLGDFTGTLHLRAPQSTGNTDVQIKALNGSILNASSILVEGYQVFDLTNAAGSTLTSTVQTNVKNNGNTFGGNVGNLTTGMTQRLIGSSNPGLLPVLVIAPGAEVVNRSGDLTLATDWDLHSYRFGPLGAPGVLTLRAAGNLIFKASLSDGFGNSSYTATLLTANATLPMNTQSWSYRLAAGADFSAADFHQVLPLANFAAGTGSLELGIPGTGSPVSGTGSNAQTKDSVKGHYQVIRTGSGDIDIAVARDVLLLNQFATIYTAGTKVNDPTMGGAFAIPVSIGIANANEGSLGATQESTTYAAQYSMAGGDVNIAAQGDIKHQTLYQGQLIDDSELQLPENWLYRRGYVDPATGKFGAARSGDVASTSWWIDFSNFFEGVGALGGGDVSLVAGGSVKNVDAVIPTNARMPGKDTSGNKLAPNASTLLELGGGDLLVQSGADISGGVYYVERGHGTLNAGGTITTNPTRSMSMPKYMNPTATVLPSQTWLPTTLFLGKGDFDVTAQGDVLLGPVVNAFLLPQGLSNTFYYKTYFSTYAATDAVSVSSLGGSITFRDSVTLPGQASTTPILVAWLQNMSLLVQTNVSINEPWIRLAESAVNPYFNSVSLLAPPSLQATAFSGDINLGGGMTLSPSPQGTLDLEAAGSINGLQPNGQTYYLGTSTPVTAWGSSQINLSDSNPDQIPGVASPSAYQALSSVGIITVNANNSNRLSQIFNPVNNLFQETGSTTGNLQSKQTLHDASLLHVNDAQPLRLYALGGDISGLTLYSAKKSDILAGNDITDVSFYIQNNNPNDTSIVSAGRNLIPYDASSALLKAASQPGSATNNVLNNTSPEQAGDIQIAGPGTLEVLAGGNLDLGTGATNSDGTGAGIVSIGQARNPYLPSSGADIIAGAGIGSAASGLAQSNLGFAAFIGKFLNPASSGTEAALPNGDSKAGLPVSLNNAQRYLPQLADLMGLSGATDTQIWSAFTGLPVEKQNQYALSIFYLVLRDAGRDHNASSSPNFGTYTAGSVAISTLFPGSTWKGDINTESRDIRTKSGGNINLFVPGGALTLATTTIGNPLTPPGIVTEDGGTISIFTHNNVDLGISRIFTLRGGNIVIWSANGNIAAGASSRTIQSAPPTRVLIDTQSADVQTDLAGLATGGGIGVLETVTGVTAGDVDLIAPLGSIDAGDAGIRVSGNLNLAAVQVLNASNIQVGGQTAGAPVAAPSLSLGSLNSASSATAGASAAASDVAKQTQSQATNAQPQEQEPSIITVEVIGYGGGEGPL